MEMWYIAKTKVGKERGVAIHIKYKWNNVEVFLPIIRRSSGRKTAFEALFPTYLFCRVDTQSDVWPSIRWVPGLNYFLGAGHQLIPVSDELVTHIKQRVAWWNEGGYLPQFTPGEQVIINRGPFSGMDGIFQRYITARQRCQVLLEVIGQLSQVELAASDLISEYRYRGLALAT